jgi:Xaa-Pro dipeptidase
MLHFDVEEFDMRMLRTRAEMAARGLDVMLLFAPESQYWLTGYDTFGYCFFQCLIVSDGEPVLLTRSADQRQAELTSTVRDIRIWRDSADADPSADLLDVLRDLGLLKRKLGWETRTQGLVHAHGAALASRLPDLIEASDLMGKLRLVKSATEIAYTRKAAELGDAAWDAALQCAAAGVSESDILADMHHAIFSAGGDYPANEFIIGSGVNALMCRFQVGRRVLAQNDQLNLEWAGTFKHYHSALFKTLIIGEPRALHPAMHSVVHDALLACEEALVAGNTMGEVFDAHARTLDAAGYGEHRLNACGYSLGPRFSPSWMEDQMFYQDAPTVIEPGMVFFLHMILMDSNTETAMCLGRTSLVTDSGSESLSRLPLEMVVK